MQTEKSTAFLMLLVSSETVERVPQRRHMKTVADEIFFPLRGMMAEPEPKMGANELLPIQTHRPEHGRYEMKADLSGIIWSVAPVSATRRLVRG